MGTMETRHCTQTFMWALGNLNSSLASYEACDLPVELSLSPIVLFLCLHIKSEQRSALEVGNTLQFWTSPCLSFFMDQIEGDTNSLTDLQ